MFPQDHIPPQTAGSFKRTRSILLGSVFGFALAGAAASLLVFPPVSSPASAQISTDRSASQYSFADVVDRVRPAVVSVKVKVTEPQTMSFNGQGFGDNNEDMPPEINRFLKRFFGNQLPNGKGMPQGGRRVTGQGSGLFHFG